MGVEIGEGFEMLSDLLRDAPYISFLEYQRWVRRLMQWQPIGRKRGGRPAHLWHTALANFCRWTNLQHWALE